jgi:hypothetical protein
MKCTICNVDFEIEQQFIRHCRKRRDVKHSQLLFNDSNVDDWVECKICGFRRKTLRDHVKVHNLTVEEYKSQYGEVYSKNALETVRANGRKMTGDKCMGENNPFYGKHHTDESKQNISDSLIESNAGLAVHFNKGRKMSDETRIRMSESRMGDKNPMFGKSRFSY